MLTRILSAPHSSAATLASCVSAAFDAEYAAAPGPGAGTFFDAMTTTRPPRGASRRYGYVARIVVRAPSALTANVLDQSAADSALIGLDGGNTPADSTRMSMPPNSLAARPAAACTWSSL